jgi:Flp pilus assembly protein TadG
MLWSSAGKTKRRGERGNLVVITGLMAIPLSMIVVMTLEMVSLSNERSRMQAAVDAAALAGARELAVAGGAARDASGFAEAFALNQVTDLAPRVSMNFTASQTVNGFQVSGVGLRASFFGNMVPPGGFKIEVSAIAESLNQQPLCILALPETEVPIGLSAISNSSIQADNCLVHSNRDMLTRDNAAIRAGTIQAFGTATGTGYAPAANNGALTVNDPFHGRNIRRSGVCNTLNPVPLVVTGNSSESLAAAVHTRNIIVSGNATLILQPGEHYFCRELRVRGNATLRGDNLVLIFDEAGTFSAADNSAISLTGRTSGDWAGFVIVATRDNLDDMEISSSSVDKLLGTIYVPEATVVIDAAGSVAEESEWSVVVAKEIKLDKNARLVINTDYAGSGVPVPAGVGNNAGPGGLRLKQ